MAKKTVTNTIVRVLLNCPERHTNRPLLLQIGSISVDPREMNHRPPSRERTSWARDMFTHKDLEGRRGIGAMSIETVGDYVIHFGSHQKIKFIESELLWAIEDEKFTHLRFCLPDGTLRPDEDDGVKRFCLRSHEYYAPIQDISYEAIGFQFDYRGTEFLQAALLTLQELVNNTSIQKEDIRLLPTVQHTWSTTSASDRLHDIAAVQGRDYGFDFINNNGPRCSIGLEYWLSKPYGEPLRND